MTTGHGVDEMKNDEKTLTITSTLQQNPDGSCEWVDKDPPVTRDGYLIPVDREPYITKYIEELRPPVVVRSARIDVIDDRQFDARVRVLPARVRVFWADYLGKEIGPAYTGTFHDTGGYRMRLELDAQENRGRWPPEWWDRRTGRVAGVPRDVATWRFEVVPMPRERLLR